MKKLRKCRICSAKVYGMDGLAAHYADAHGAVWGHKPAKANKTAIHPKTIIQPNLKPQTADLREILPPPKATKKRKFRRHILTRKQDFQLFEWLNKKWDLIVQNKSSLDATVVAASHDLGFVVTGHNVKGVLEATGRIYPSTRKPHAKARSRGLVVLAKHLAGMYRINRQEVPEDLLDLIPEADRVTK